MLSEPKIRDMRPGRSAADILAGVAARNNITVSDLKGDRRFRHIAWPRQEAMWRLRRERHLSFPTIARLLHLKEHTAVTYGVRVYEARLFTGDDPLGFWPCLFVDKVGEA